MKKTLNIILGCVFIALAYNIFFLPYDLVSTGFFGIGALINYETNYDPAVFILIMNFACIMIAFFTLKKAKIKEYIIPGFLIPVLIFLFSNINNYLIFDKFEIILAVISGAFLTGFGYSLLHKENQSVGGIDILQDVINSAKVYRTKTLSYFIEGSILIATFYFLNIETMLYSLISIAIIRYQATKSKIGVSSSKTFYIITQKEEVKDYILNELEHDLTEFNVKGGYSNNRSKIIMTAVDTKDYYRLKEGISLIDPTAFISIIDSYEVINKNVSLKKKKKNKK